MKENTYFDILEAAATLVEEVGYNKTTHRAIAEVVGIKAASIYYHFKTKDELLFKLLENTISCMRERQETALLEGGTLRENLHTLIYCELSAFVEKRKGESAQALIHEWRYLSTGHQQALLEMRAPYEVIWNTVLADCYKEGLLKADPKITRRILNGALAWGRYWYQEEGPLSIKDIAKEVTKLVVPN